MQDERVGDCEGEQNEGAWLRREVKKLTFEISKVKSVNARGRTEQGTQPSPAFSIV
jgi:hypothetical protein